MPTAPSRKRIAVSETLMCGLKTAFELVVPGGTVVTRAVDLVERVNSRHEILSMKEVQEKHERELSQFERRMRDMVHEEMRGMVTTFQSGGTTGAILEKEIRNYFAINQHGYAPAMFEGLLRQSPHWEDLRRSPQNYGEVLEPGQALNPKKIPVLIEADPLRVLELMPFAFASLLTGQRGTNDDVEIAGAQDVWVLRAGEGGGHNGTAALPPVRVAPRKAEENATRALSPTS